MAKERKKQKIRKSSWRDYDDRFHRSFPALPQPESLHPNEYTMIRAAMGEEEATAIIASWQLVVPVRVVEVLHG
jgi:hypothetical protein